MKAGMAGANPGNGIGSGVPARQLRCAIYTRKSSEHGLEQEFNSLDNQREAAEAYIKSQSHEGWRLLPEHYDDGGYSGGSMDRPALQRLLAEVRAGRVSVIIVYKVDRLTRSLSDFAKLVELFDAHGVSFVSVTQAFNTTTSMGRLTLNVLLSFAQFEREVTGERIRDKIAASKRKGIRVGGPVPLGYITKDKKLVVHETEAETVALIFRRYLDLGCLSSLVQDLKARGIVTKLNERSDGSRRGGNGFTKAPLAHLLRNRCYIGELVHKSRYYPGEHQPIIDRDLFEAVQAKLDDQARRTGIPAFNTGSILAGLLYDDAGNRMHAATTKKNRGRYRYYISAALNQNRPRAAGSIARVPAPEIEAAVLAALDIDPPTNSQSDGSICGTDSDGHTQLEVVPARIIAQRVERIVIERTRLVMTLRRSPDGQLNGTTTESMPKSEPETKLDPMILPFVIPPRRRRRSIINVADEAHIQPMRSETRARLVDGIAKARRWLDDLIAGRVADTAAIARQECCSERSVRMTLNLAFLSPKLVQAAVDGTLPSGLGIIRLTDMPSEWQAQISRVAEL